MSKKRLLCFLLVVVWVSSCSQDYDTSGLNMEEKQQELTSAEAVFVDFEWDGELTGSGSNVYSSIDEQLKWTIGQLNGDKSVGRIDHVELSNVNRVGNSISYRAKMVVAWGKSRVPENYSFHLPLDTTYAGLGNFLSKYKDSCMGDTHGEEPTLSDAWYYYRPNNALCDQDAADTVTVVAEVSPNTDTTSGKFPEYHKVWEDDTLRIVAIFGKVEEDGDEDDSGYKGFNRMVFRVYDMLRAYNVETDPADIETESGYYPDVPAPEHTDVEIRATLPDGKRVVANIFSVPSIRQASNEFYQRYESVSAAADFISYNGHSGLGSNIRALATKGKWVRDQYTIVLMNGCTTFAYVDSALANAHKAVNPDDTTGDKYLDVFTNARPAYFSHNVDGVMAIVNALMDYDNPRTYEQILRRFHVSQVALVSGEEDNVYSPQMPVDGKATIFERANVPSKQWKHFGPYSVGEGGIIKAYTRGNRHAGEGILNDADLYIRKGSQPTSSSYDCASTSPHATEQCVLGGEGEYYVSVFGWTENVDTIFDITVVYKPSSSEYCGDGIVGTLEFCDGNTLPCSEIDPSYVAGEGVCNGTCTGYDVSSCLTPGEIVVVEEEGIVNKNEWLHFGPFSHTDGTFRAVMTGSNDADLYVRIGGQPTRKEYDCRPYKSMSRESCVLEGPGEYYVSVNGYKAENAFALTIRFRN